MKKIYIGSFVLFGFLLQLLLHGGIEIWYINLLISDFNRFSFGFTWEQWMLIHDILGTIAFFVGIVLGYAQGKLWWYRIYEPQFQHVGQQAKQTPTGNPMGSSR